MLIRMLYVFALATSLSAEVRTLTDTQGRAIDANILHVDSDSVLVDLSGGREFDIPLERLSQADQEYLREWKAPAVKTPENPIDAVVIFKSLQSSGSGFFANDRGRTYVYTNQHVISDIRNLVVTDSMGRNVKLGSLEVSDSKDMARFLVSPREALQITDTVSSNESLTVLGNSEGAGVVTSSKARVKGVGPFEVEVDADFVPGNSGGPVINESGEVVGMATYIRPPQDTPEWVTKDTRYGKARRFTLRPSRINDWIKVTSEEYAKQRAELDAYRHKFDQAYWTFRMLDEGKGWLSTIPSNWHRDILNILSNHNRRQKRPDATRTSYYVNGYYQGSSTVDHSEKKEASRRANLRALDRFIGDELSSFYRLNDSYLKVGYFRVNEYDGSLRLEKQVAALRAEISKEIEFSQAQN